MKLSPVKDSYQYTESIILKADAEAAKTLKLGQPVTASIKGTVRSLRKDADSYSVTIDVQEVTLPTSNEYNSFVKELEEAEL